MLYREDCPVDFLRESRFQWEVMRDPALPVATARAVLEAKPSAWEIRVLSGRKDLTEQGAPARRRERARPRQVAGQERRGVRRAALPARRLAGAHRQRGGRRDRRHPAQPQLPRGGSTALRHLRLGSGPAPGPAGDAPTDLGHRVVADPRGPRPPHDRHREVPPPGARAWRSPTASSPPDDEEPRPCTIRLTPAQADRACGVLIASAAGDALGAGYEFAHVAPDLVPTMIGGGLGDFAPGEWTDDTSQAVAIARVAATGVDLRTPEALTQIAQGFADWYAGGPADVGIQTSAVLSRAGRNPTGAEMAEAARVVHERSGRSAGNGSLDAHRPGRAGLPRRPRGPRRGRDGGQRPHPPPGHRPGGLRGLVPDDPARGAARRAPDVRRHRRRGCPTRDEWRELLLEAETKPPSSFARNGWAGRRPAGGVVGDHPHPRARPTGPPAVTSSTRSPPRSASATTPTPSPRSPARCSARGGG